MERVDQAGGKRHQGRRYKIVREEESRKLVDRALGAFYLAAVTIDFTCQKCEGSFEVDAQDLIDGNEKLMCPHCDAKAPANLVDDFTNALTELRSSVAALSKKFAVTMAVETEDVEEEADEDEDEDEDLDEDDEDLDFDEDDVEDDESEDLDDEDEDR